MSHQTGITANDELLKVFGSCKNGKIRLIKISIENEQLTCACTREIEKDWEKDYDTAISSLIEESVPCYILYRLDEKSDLGYKWLLLSWIPDDATIRQKMVYASTKATLKSDFGSAHITEEVHATSVEETTLQGYYKNKKSFSAPVPLTTREEELNELKRSEVNTDISTDTRQQTMSGINFPITDETKTAIIDLTKGLYDYIQFKINLQEENIELVKATKITLNQLPKEVPNDEARYHIYVFKHTHEGDYQEAFVFIYSMPGYSCSVKERMIYSSCKAPFLKTIETMGVEISKKVEIDDGSELTEEFLQDEIHPKEILHRPQFAKPRGPANRGAKRLTRPQPAE